MQVTIRKPSMSYMQAAETSQDLEKPVNQGSPVKVNL